MNGEPDEGSGYDNAHLFLLGVPPPTQLHRPSEAFEASNYADDYWLISQYAAIREVPQLLMLAVVSLQISMRRQPRGNHRIGTWWRITSYVYNQHKPEQRAYSEPIAVGMWIRNGILHEEG